MTCFIPLIPECLKIEGEVEIITETCKDKIRQDANFFYFSKFYSLLNNAYMAWH